MNIFTDALVLFVFLFIIFYLKTPNINSDNYLKHKAYLFGLVLLFSCIMNIIIIAVKGCKIQFGKIVGEALKMAIIVVIGYAIYTDLQIMTWTKDYFEKYTGCEQNYCTYLSAGLFLTFFTIIVRFIDLIIGSPLECIKS